MALFRITASASSRLRELLESCGTEPHVVVLYWTGPQADVHRRSDGTAEWNRFSDGQWNVALDSRAQYEVVRRQGIKELRAGPAVIRWEVVEDIEFIVKELSHHQNIDGRTLDYANGAFHVF